MIRTDLPVDPCKQRFAATRRVQIANVLDSEAAEFLVACLAEEIPWELVFRRGAEVVTLSAADIAQLDPSQTARVMEEIQNQARQDFQFVYWKFSIVDAYRRGLLPGLFVHRLLEALASAEVIDWVRSVTGLHDIRKVDAQATLYRPGNFLTEHNDEQEGQHHRRAAYVIQLCRHWRPDWGGLLHFLDERSVVETFVPGFNQMALFAVPQRHSVSMVTPFARAPRFAVTGWFTA